MAGPLGGGRAGLVDDVVGVEVTIDGTLLIADRLHLVDFPTALGIRQNIPQEDLRNLVWDQVQRDLTAQGVLDSHGQPHPTVAAMVDTIARPDRMLEGRWWRRDAGGVMVRFVVCRQGERHVIAARDGDLLVLQLVAPQVGLAGMVTTVLGPAEPANVEPSTGLSAELAKCTTAAQLAQYGIEPTSARIYAEITGNPSSWVEITASQRHHGGTFTQTEVAAGVLDSAQGRLVSLPRRVGGELYGSFAGTRENLQRTLDGLLKFLPAGAWARSCRCIPTRLSSAATKPERKKEPMPQYEDHDDLAALDFSSYASGSDDVGQESDALDFSVADDSDEDAAADALSEYIGTAGARRHRNGIGRHRFANRVHRDRGRRGRPPAFHGDGDQSARNRLGVGAHGRPDPGDRAVAESDGHDRTQLAEEILVIAGLARQKGLAAQHSLPAAKR